MKVDAAAGWNRGSSFIPVTELTNKCFCITMLSFQEKTICKMEVNPSYRVHYELTKKFFCITMLSFQEKINATTAD